jgi:hypothetical protein
LKHSVFRTLKRTKGDQEEAIALLFEKDEFELEVEEEEEENFFPRGDWGDVDEEDAEVTVDNEVSVKGAAERGSSPSKARKKKAAAGGKKKAGGRRR